MARQIQAGKRLQVALLTLLLSAAGFAESPNKSRKAASTPAPNPQATATYVGSAACSRCHLEIAAQFTKTSMGRSLTPITPEFLKTLQLPGHFYDAKLNHHYEVHAENNQLVQSEYQTDASGKEVFRNTHAAQWIIGTGENGFGALLRRGDYLFQAPLSFYSKASEWNLSPGYQNGDYGFNRVIQPGCIYCHSGRPQPISGRDGAYQPTAFTQTAIGCENCHGPGSAHIEAMHESDAAPGKSTKADPTIVNPERLPSQLANDVCTSCHQSGDARVLQSGKTYQDFRPGQPLNQTVAIFQIAPTRDNPPDKDHTEHYYSMSLSQCFLKTQATANPLRCISCHNPHVEPTAAEAPAYFNGRCLTCHTPGPGIASCKAPQAARQATAHNGLPADNCIGCHMPKRDIGVISHSNATNHRVPARPDEAFPEETFSQTTAAMPDIINLNAIGPRDSHAATPPAIVRLQAYALLKASKPQFNASWVKTLTELEAAPPNDPAQTAILEAAIGHRELDAKDFAKAILHLQRALQIDPLQPNAWVDLSEAQDQSSLTEEAIVSQKKAIELDPFVAAMQKTLVFRLINGKHYEEAVAAMEKYLSQFPEDDFMRKMLAIARQP